jgi:uncharacterized repeat protein (TIGR03803 family)
LGAASAALMIVIVVTLVLAPGAWAQGKYKTLYKFKGGKDGIPQAGVIFDPAGNLYGTTTWGGTDGCGSVYELTPNSDGSWTKSVLHNFTCSDGHYPAANLIFDQAGNLYGTTIWGDPYNGGTVFELTKNSDGSWTHNALYNFTGGQDGYEPFFDILIFDGAGNLYGTTYRGGSGYGVAYKLTPNPDGSWTESVLHTFTGGDGGNSRAGLIFDGAGNLYGMAQTGGAYGQGAVFELAPNPDGSWTESVLHSFTGGKDGGQPYGGLIFDPAGNLYGMTYQGGAHGWGNVFELIPNGNGNWKEKVLHQFTGGKDGGNPQDRLIFDAAGNLYGTTGVGGAGGHGVVFKLSPNSKGAWYETVLHTFLDRPGAGPVADVIFDAVGNLYGTTDGDGTTTFGSVFEITP